MAAAPKEPSKRWRTASLKTMAARIDGMPEGPEKETARKELRELTSLIDRIAELKGLGKAPEDRIP